MDESQKILRNILCMAVFAGMLTANTLAQTIRLVRTDVESGRSGFVTATQSFGVDVVIDSLSGCTSASFELRYTNAKYCVFSHWKTRDLGKKGVFVYDLTDSTGNGSVHVGALSGMGVTDSAFTNPVVIHLDFVVLPDAPNDSTITFSFIYPQAVTTDSGGTIVQLATAPYTVTIHGFVSVYPGDADNNKVVDSRDATTVGAYLKQGSGTSNVRGYKREPASTLWLPQASLVWDSAMATFADCDGSGDVTLSDNLVVQINFGKTHSRAKSTTSIQSAKNVQFPAELARVPLRVTTQENLLGVAVRATLTEPSARVIGFEPAPNVTGAYPSFVHCDDGNVLLVFGSEQGKNCLQSGVIGSFVFDGNTSDVMFNEVLGATADGRIFPLYQTTTAIEERTCPTNDPCTVRVELDRSGSTLIVRGSSEDVSGMLRVSTVTGREVLQVQVESETRIPVDLPYGLYIVSLSSAKPYSTTILR